MEEIRRNRGEGLGIKVCSFEKRETTQGRKRTCEIVTLQSNSLEICKLIE